MPCILITKMCPFCPDLLNIEDSASAAQIWWPRLLHKWSSLWHSSKGGSSHPPFLRQPPRDPAGLPILKSLLSLPSISPHFKVFQTVSPLCRRQSPSCLIQHTNLPHTVCIWIPSPPPLKSTNHPLFFAKPPPPFSGNSSLYIGFWCPLPPP